ncbi:MAG TPA: FAD-dependent oxidoreductase [Leucothrix mucor]|uniref:FAD-dependent oxidoreductase n=1 Tax=Leucothrix mucor TaxID=45248 RepID=A0A7V2SYG9_LEUMU|nr:FAD-dependent oxidoreductase [Leucothrix mucor]
MMSKNKIATPWFDYPQFNWDKKQAIVIGGGIAGCQSAWHLLQTGWQVMLIERHHKLAAEASGNIAGAIMPKVTALPSLGESFYSVAFAYTLNQLTQLKSAKKQIDYSLCGVLQLAHNPREEKRWVALQQRGFANDFLQCLTAEQTQQRSGITSLYKSTYFPQGGWISPASFCQALIDHPNCEVLLHREALHLQQDQQQWQVLDATNTLLAQAEVVVIANGKDLTQFEQTKHLPIMPVLGQTSQANASMASAKLQMIIGHEGYLTPAVKGQHIFGATFERNSDQAIINPQADAINQQQLNHYLPDFYDSLGKIKSSHAAIRMTTPDRFPYAGGLINQTHYQRDYADIHQGKQWKQYPVGRYLQGLFVLAGLGSRGLTTAGYCASIMVDIINSKPSKGNIPNALHAGRFTIRQLKKKNNRHP